MNRNDQVAREIEDGTYDGREGGERTQRAMEILLRREFPGVHELFKAPTEPGAVDNEAAASGDSCEE